jgi:hypothetical protein
MADFEQITLKFDGGLAATGKLHFYEFGRSQYAFARFIATVEHFRRTGEVAEHIGARTYVDIIVSSPEEGSFIESILVPAAVKAGKDFVAARLASLLSYVWHFISPRREKTDEVMKELAQIRLAESRERTRQERERTKQAAILRDIAEGSRATTDKALDLVRWAISSSNRAVGRLDISPDEWDEMQNELEAEQKRIDEFKESERQLAKIEEETMNRLIPSP